MDMKFYNRILGGLAVLLAGAVFAQANPPNIVFIMADDMGVGDVAALNPEAKVETPNLDALVAGGMHFTDAHTASAVCTPTRYGLLTGRYSWRSGLKERVLSGYDPCLISKDRKTVASMLKGNGYNTAMIGKWHLGITWTKKDGSVFTAIKSDEAGMEEQIDFSAPIQLGPRQLGFDYFFGTAASWDMAPYAFIENDRLQYSELVPYTGTPLIADPPELAKAKKSGASRDELKKIANNYPKAAWRSGVHEKGLKASDALPEITKHASGYIADYQGEKPFFLYVPFTAPHTPVVPNEQFLGKSRAGTYGDFVQEVDWAVGEVVQVLKASGQFKNTLLIFTTDNGYSPKAFPDAQKEQFGHNPSFIYNGRKGRLLEGGHRVPFIATWPGTVKAGSRSDVLVCLNDFFATCAEITGTEIPDNTAEDSVSFLSALKGSPEPVRDTLVSRDFGGYLAIRKGDWKLCFSKNPNAYKLYNLADDIGEQKNLFKMNPEKVEMLKATITKIVHEGRSTPGAKQKNDGPEWWKQLCWLTPEAGK